MLAAAAEPVGDAALLWRACARLGIERRRGGAGRGRRACSRLGGARDVLPSARALGGLPRRVAGRAARRCTARWPRRPTRSSIPTAAPGIARRRPPGRTRTSPPSSSARPSRAQARGGLAAAAAFLERAAALTADPARRTERALAAAQAKHEAGAADAALDLLAIAELGPLDELQRARAERLRARLAFAQRRGSDAPPLLLQAARRLEPLDPALARETYLEALGAALTTGQRDSLERGVAGAARAARAEPPRAVELLLTGQALVITDGRAAGDAGAAARAGRVPQRAAVRRGRAARARCTPASSRSACGTTRAGTCSRPATSQLARDAGALTVLPLALEMHCRQPGQRGRVRRRRRP